MLSGDEVLTLLNKLGHKLNSSKLAKIMEEYDKDQWAPTTTTTAAAAAAIVWQAGSTALNTGLRQAKILHCSIVGAA